MTTDKSFKNRVRARMSKTGESYTTARRQLLARSTPPAPPETVRRESAGVRALAHSEKSVREGTGHGWDEWFALLDAWGAADRGHPAIARWLTDGHGVDGWWAQTITVRYEQTRGLRVPGQTSDGYFSVTGSKTVAVPVDRLFEAFTDPELRERWLPGVKLTVRTATAPKSLRADWNDDSTRIAVGFVPKGEGRAQVAVGHERLPDGEAAARMKLFWHDRLADLKRVLEP
jgi:hypothetical protein